MSDAVCCICGSHSRTAGTPGYWKCSTCKHEQRRDGRAQSLLVNEKLDAARMKRADLKDRFQVGLARRARREPGTLVDLGCGPGRFLFHARAEFPAHYGVEITPEVRQFARQQMGVNVHDHVDDSTLRAASVVTLWHSLEHFPPEVQQDYLKRLHAHLPPGARVVISVPNVESLHWRLFAQRSVYYDLPHHPHQFSTTSLYELLGKNGFRPAGSHVSLAYSWFGGILSALNFFTPHNYLYLTLRRGGLTAKLPALAACGVLAALAAAPAFLLYLYEKAFPKRAGVLTTVFVKR